MLHCDFQQKVETGIAQNETYADHRNTKLQALYLFITKLQLLCTSFTNPNLSIISPSHVVYCLHAVTEAI